MGGAQRGGRGVELILLAVPTWLDLKGFLMALDSDIPSYSQVEGLLAHRGASSVSIYLPTDRTGEEAHANRTELKKLGAEAAAQLRAASATAADVAAVEGAIEALVADDDFWTHLSETLVVFADPTSTRTYRLPNQLLAAVEVSDRFHVKPLLRTVTFPQAAFVLALAAGSVRLLHISPNAAPEEVRVVDLPADAWGPGGNHVFKERQHSYVRLIERALRPVLNGQTIPLILAATEGLAAAFASVNTYPHLAPQRSAGNPETTSDADLAAEARVILDVMYADEVEATKELFELRSSQGRAVTDVSDAARWATYGAIDTVLVDIDESLPGFVDDAGAVTFAAADDAVNYGVVDEIARRVFLTGGRVLAVRSDDIPQGGPVAAILRYAP